MIKRFIIIFSLVYTTLYSKENLELGLGVGFISTPSYIGSKEQKNRILPFPYIDYKGKYFNINREKIYNQFYDKNKLQIEVSIRGMLPAKSDNTIREGMPNLDPMIEFGPMFTYNLSKKENQTFDLLFPIRMAYTVNSDSFLEYQGLISSIDFKYKSKLINKYKFILTSGIGFNEKKYNDYYYEVESKYANSNRKEYSSKGGYSGYHISAALTRKDKNIWYGSFFKYYYLDGAVFEKSPLVETKHSLFYGIGFSYLF